MSAKPEVEIDLVNPCLIYPKQNAFVMDKARYTWVEAGTKTGKTVGMLFWLFWQACKLRKGEFWWVAPVYKQAKIAFRRMRRFIAKEMIKSINESELRIELLWGSTIQFCSAEKPDNLYGEDVRAAVLDECSRMRQEAWHAVRSTLTATGGRAKLIGNVKGRKNWFYHGARKAEAGEPGNSYHRLVTIDNPFIPQSEIDDAQRALPEAIFNELYLAIPTEDGGNPFGISHINNCVDALSEKDPAVWGIDLAKSFNWSVAIALDEDGAVCRFERWQGSWQTTKQRIKSLVGYLPAYIDSTGVGDPIVEELQEELANIIGFKFSAGSKQQLMEGLAAAIQQRLISFPDGAIRSELECFEFEYTRTGVRYGAPEGMNDDCVCALALAWSGAKESSRGAYQIRDPRTFSAASLSPDSMTDYGSLALGKNGFYSIARLWLDPLTGKRHLVEVWRKTTHPADALANLQRLHAKRPFEAIGISSKLYEQLESLIDNSSLPFQVIDDEPDASVEISSGLADHSLLIAEHIIQNGSVWSQLLNINSDDNDVRSAVAEASALCLQIF